VTPKATRRLLFIAVGLSLLVHAVLLGWLRSPFAVRQSDAPAVTIAHARIVRITQATPTPHAPAPQPSPTARGSAPPRPVATAGRGVAIAHVTPAPPTPTPKPAAVAAASPCRRPSAPAGLESTPAPAEIPAEARAAATNGTSAVLVHLDATGGVLSAAISGSSGNPSLDTVALAMAKSAVYVPAYKDCKAVASDYTFEAKWLAW
jgi:TonB family protein